MASMASRRVLPVALVLISFSQPLYHGQLGEASIMLSPLKPEMGTKGTCLGLYPTFLMKLDVSLMISLKRSSDHLTKTSVMRSRRARGVSRHLTWLCPSC